MGIATEYGNLDLKQYLEDQMLSITCLVFVEEQLI